MTLKLVSPPGLQAASSCGMAPFPSLCEEKEPSTEETRLAYRVSDASISLSPWRRDRLQAASGTLLHLFALGALLYSSGNISLDPLECTQLLFEIHFSIELEAFWGDTGGGCSDTRSTWHHVGSSCTGLPWLSWMVSLDTSRVLIWGLGRGRNCKGSTCNPVHGAL